MSSVDMQTVNDADDGLRLDRWFRAHYPALSHGGLEKLLRKGQVRVNGGRVKSGFRLTAGDTVRVPPLPPSPGEGADRARKPQRADAAKLASERAFIKSITLYEDDALLVLNKPFGLAVQGGSGVTRNVDAILGALAGPEDERPRLVHRLDRDTGGVLVLAKSRKIAARVSDALKKHDVEKTYWALTVGSPRPRAGTINLAISKTEKPKGGGERMAEGGADAKKAITDYMVIDDAGSVAFVALKPVTGRTHQLRVHCAAIETVIVGDFKYGGAGARIDGVAEKLHLFCRTMRMRHPLTGKIMAWTAPLTGHMEETWRFFNFPQPAAIDWPDLRPAKR